MRTDITALTASPTAFKLRLAYAHEIMDRYGRMLAYISPEWPTPPRPAPYNLRMLEGGAAMPYFIWPNINPFHNADSIVAAVPSPTDIPHLASSNDLGRARSAVAAARASGSGLFGMPGGLHFQPFELRYLADRRAPERRVIDLRSSSQLLLPPQSYYTIPNPEDRLFINSEHVPLFQQKGWQV